MRSSEKLIRGQLYSRKKLAEEFGIRDATIRTGIFQPKGHSSIWLFITEKKSADRFQYKDALIGNDLDWESQPTGRKDGLIANHEKLGLEVLLFHRPKKNSYPGYAFRYEGPFRHVSHEGTRPVRFHFERVQPGISLSKSEVEDALTQLQGVNKPSKGQGFRVHPAVRRAIEKHAMQTAAKHFEAQGYVVKDVSAYSSYDLRCSRGDVELYVEVKGTQTKGEDVLLTRNEVEHARRNAVKMVLFVVHSIRVSGDENSPQLSGGEVRLIRPWNIDEGSLEPLAFAYSLPPT